MRTRPTACISTSLTCQEPTRGRPHLHAGRPLPGRRRPADARRGAGRGRLALRRAPAAPPTVRSCSKTPALPPPPPPVHPQDATAYLNNDIYRLSVSVEGAGWTAQLRNALAAVEFGGSAPLRSMSPAPPTRPLRHRHPDRPLRERPVQNRHRHLPGAVNVPYPAALPCGRCRTCSGGL